MGRAKRAPIQTNLSLRWPNAGAWSQEDSRNSPRRGRNKPAQGIALGDRSGIGTLALKGRYK